jgi:5-methylcytosine-specific restriction endonuclease McrA
LRRKRPRPAGYHWDAREPEIHPSNGRRSCRWCRGPVEPPRRNWCGNPACVEAWKIRTDPAALRAAVFARDRGVCARCGLDGAALDPDAIRRELEAAAEALRREWARPGPPPRPDGLRRLLDALGAALEWRARNNVPAREPAWQVDHVTPVSEGGDYFEMANLATLCVPCHRDKSRAEARAAREAGTAARCERRRAKTRAKVAARRRMA